MICLHQQIAINISIEATSKSKTNRKLSKQIKVAADFSPAQRNARNLTFCQSEVATKKQQMDK